MRITIFGASGLLGKALMRAGTGHELSGFSSRDADIRNPQLVCDLIERLRPNWVILAAAYTDVDGCETNRDLAFAVNTQGAEHVAQAAKKHGSRLLFLSSDYVFDGAKTTPYEVDDPRRPRSVYGQSKASAEESLTRILPECCIVRTSWLFGVGGKCFPDTILKLATTKKVLDVVEDQRGSPTYTDDLAGTIFQLCHCGAAGIVHVTNRDACSWFEFARQIVSRAGLDNLVRPTTSDKFIRPAERPKYSVLSSASLGKYGIEMPTWQDALVRYLADRNSST